MGSVLSKDVADVLRSVAGGAALPDTAFQAVTTCVFQVLAREEGVTEEDLYGEWSHRTTVAWPTMSVAVVGVCMHHSVSLTAHRVTELESLSSLPPAVPKTLFSALATLVLESVKRGMSAAAVGYVVLGPRRVNTHTCSRLAPCAVRFSMLWTPRFTFHTALLCKKLEWKKLVWLHLGRCSQATKRRLGLCFRKLVGASLWPRSIDVQVSTFVVVTHYLAGACVFQPSVFPQSLMWSGDSTTT